MLHLFGLWLFWHSPVSQKASHSSVSHPWQSACYTRPLLQRLVCKESALSAADCHVSWDLHQPPLLLVGLSSTEVWPLVLSTFLWSCAGGWGLFACEWEKPAKCTSELYLVHWITALFLMRFGVWGPPACKVRDSETQPVSVFNIVHLCSRSFAATCSFQIGSVPCAEGGWLACPQSLSQTSQGGCFQSFSIKPSTFGTGEARDRNYWRRGV